MTAVARMRYCRWRAAWRLALAAAGLWVAGLAGTRGPLVCSFTVARSAGTSASWHGTGAERRRPDHGITSQRALRAAPGAQKAAFKQGGALGELCLQCLVALTVAAAVCLCPSAPSLAAEVTSDVTGFAEFAEKGGAMDVNPSCFVTSCGKQTKECFAEDSRCLKGALCLSRCRGGQDCATQCFAEFGCKRLDAWLNCTVETEKCVSVPPQLIDVKKWYSENTPKKLPNFDVSSMQGVWYKVRGYNPKYDCYMCQPNTFNYKPGSSSLEADIQLRIARLRSGGAWQNNVKENLVISAESDRSTFKASGEIFGLTFDEEWYVVAGDDDYKLVAYKGKNLQDIYEGAFIYTRTPTLPASVEARARQAAEANGYVWSKFCVIDNACPTLPPAKEEAAKLEWDDVPDLIEWFAPGTIPKKQFSGQYK